MKRFVCCIFAAFIAVTTALAQEPARLISRNDFGAVAQEGQSELIINCTRTIKIINSDFKYVNSSIVVSVNGSIAAHLYEGEVTKVIVNNGNVSIEAQSYGYSDTNGWYTSGKASSIVVNPNSQSIQIEVNQTGISTNAKINIAGIQSLGR